MNWVFLDPSRWDYDVSTPGTAPLGGSQSALCYLATALARRGAAVTTLTGTSRPGTIAGVRCLRYDEGAMELFAAPDTIIVVLNGPAELAGDLFAYMTGAQALVLWTGHAHDQRPMASLSDPGCAALWDRIVCVSDWQRENYRDAFGIPLEKVDIARNAMAPAFEGLFDDEAALDSAKGSSPLRLAYTSTPFRGLDVLLACYPAVRRLHEDCRLDVFSSMQVYGMGSDLDPHRELYARCRSTEGVDYRGSVSQAALARELAGTSILAYPNTFAETSCISVMEALAAGLLVVTSNLAALPETCDGWARLVEPIGPGRDANAFALDYARELDRALSDWTRDRQAMLAKRHAQVRAMNETCTWDVRAGQWEAMAERWRA